uniref:MSP domain-containing protein n=1 Tax=Cacopsylla melanoneura TaxID=428564 RepID=A0A8D8W9M2_9HEMI
MIDWLRWAIILLAMLSKNLLIQIDFHLQGHQDNTPPTAAGVSRAGDDQQRFDLSLRTPLKALSRLNILYTGSHGTEYRLKFTLNDDVSFANVNVTNMNRLPFALSARVHLSRIVQDLQLRFDVQSSDIAVFVAENGTDLFDFKYEGANSYIVRLKFKDNTISSELELGDNTMVFDGRWNAHTLAANSEYSVTYKDLWFDCLIKGNIRSSAFANDYNLLIAHDSDSNKVNDNVFNTEIRVNKLLVTHRLVIQMDSSLHNKWINSLQVNNNSIVNEYHQILVNPRQTDYSYLMLVNLNQTLSTFNLSYATNTGKRLGVDRVDFEFSVPQMDAFRINYAIDANVNAKFDLAVGQGKYVSIVLVNRDSKHYELGFDSSYLTKLIASVNLEQEGRVLITFTKNKSNYSCVVHYDIESYAKVSLTLALHKDASRDLEFKTKYDFTGKDYVFDLSLAYNFSSLYSNRVSIGYSSVYLSRYELNASSDFELLHDLSCLLKFDFEKSDQSIALNVLINKDKSLNLATNLSKLPNKIALTAGLDSNLVNSEQNNYTLGLSVETVNSHDYLIELKYGFNDKIIALHSKLLYDNNAILIECELRTPLEHYELVLIEFNIKWTSMNNYNLIFRLQKNAVVTHLNASIVINNENLSYNGFIYLNSPHEIFNNVHTDFNISFHNGLNFNVKLENTNKTIQFVCVNNLSNTVLNMLTPYPGFENITLSSMNTNEQSNLLIFKNKAQWVKLSFERTNVKNILFTMELPSYVFINKIDLKIDLDKNIVVKIDVVKFNKQSEHFSMEFTGGEFKCTINLASLNINNFTAHVKFSVNTAKTNVKIFVKIVNDVTSILYLKINYDEKKNLYLNLFRPMTNVSYVNIAGSYRLTNNTGRARGKNRNEGEKKGEKEYILTLDMTEIDRDLKYNVVILENNTIRFENRTNLLYTLQYGVEKNSLHLNIVKDSLELPFLSLDLNFESNKQYNVELNVNNTDNYFKYIKFNVNFNNITSKGRFLFEYLNKVKSSVELDRQDNGLVNIDTKLIVNFDSLVNVKTKLTVNRSEIIPHVADLSYNYMVGENYVEFALNYEKLKFENSELSVNYKLNNKAYSFKLGNNSLLVHYDILELDIFITKTISSIFFDFESFSLHFEHNLESTDQFVMFNFTNIQSKNLYLNIALTPTPVKCIHVDFNYAKYETRFKLDSFFIEEFALKNTENGFVLIVSTVDQFKFYYDLRQSKDILDSLSQYPQLWLIGSVLDEVLIEFHPRHNSTRNTANVETPDNTARNAFILNIQHNFYLVKLDDSAASVKYANDELQFKSSLMTGNLLLKDFENGFPKLNLSGVVYKYGFSFVHNMDINSIEIKDVRSEDIVFAVQRSKAKFNFVHKIADDTVNLNYQPGIVRFSIEDSAKTKQPKVSATIDFNPNKVLNATLKVLPLDLDIGLSNEYYTLNGTIVWKFTFTSSNNVYQVQYNGNLNDQNELVVDVPNVNVYMTNSHYNMIETLLKINGKQYRVKFTTDYSRKDSNISPKLNNADLFLHVNEKDVHCSFRNTNNDMKLTTVVHAENVTSEVTFSSRKSKNINLELVAKNLPLLKYLSLSLNCYCATEIRVNSHIVFETFEANMSATNRTKNLFEANIQALVAHIKHIQLDLVTNETTFALDLTSNILKTIHIKMDLDREKSEVNGQLKIDDKFVNVTARVPENSTQVTIDLTSTEFKPINMVGTLEKVDKGSRMTIEILNSKEGTIDMNNQEGAVKSVQSPVNSLQIVYSLAVNNTILNIVGHLNNKPIISADISYDLRPNSKQKIVYLNMKYKNKQVFLLETKFNAHEFLFNYKMASHVLDSRTHLDYKLQVQLNLNEIKNGVKFKILAEFPEVLRLNETIYLKLNPQSTVLQIQYKDSVDVVANASDAKIALNLFGMNFVTKAKYGDDRLQVDFKNIDTPTNQHQQTPPNPRLLNPRNIAPTQPGANSRTMEPTQPGVIPIFTLPDFDADFSFNRNSAGHTVFFNIQINAALNGVNLTTSAKVNVNDSNLIVNGQFNGKTIDLMLTNDRDQGVSIGIESEMFELRMLSVFNEREIVANYSLEFLNEVHKFVFLWNNTCVSYSWNDFSLNLQADKPTNTYTLIHVYKEENHVNIQVKNSSNTFHLAYFGVTLDLELDSNLKFRLNDSTSHITLGAKMIQMPGQGFEVEISLDTPSGPVRTSLKRSLHSFDLKCNVLDNHSASFSVNEKGEALYEVTLDYSKSSPDSYHLHSTLSTDRSTLKLNSNLNSKNMSTNVITLEFHKNITMLDLNVYDSLLVNYDFVHNHTFTARLGTKELNSSFNVDFTRSNIYVNVNLLSYAYEFEYEIVPNKILLKFQRFYQRTLMQHMLLDYHYVRDYYKCKVIVYSLFGMNVESDASLSFNAKNVNGALHYTFNKLENSLVFKVDKTSDMNKTVELIVRLPSLKLKNYKLNFYIDQEKLLSTVNEINNKKLGHYLILELINTPDIKKLSFKTPVTLSRNIFLTFNTHLNLADKSIVLNGSYLSENTVLFGFNSTNKMSTTNLNSDFGLITPYAPYESISVRVNVPLSKNVNTIFYSLNMGGDQKYEILYDKTNSDRRKSYAIYRAVTVWNFVLNNNNLELNLNMLSNSINITSMNLASYNLSLTNAEKNLTISSNLKIAMTNSTNSVHGVNEFIFGVNYMKNRTESNYTFNFVLENELNANKKLSLHIAYPNNTVQFTFEFKYKSIYKNVFKIHTNIFKPISLLIKNNFSNKRDLSTYCEAKYSNNYLFVNFEHKLAANNLDVSSNINITINNKTLVLDIYNKFVSRDNLDMQIALQTPLVRLDSAFFYFKINQTAAEGNSTNYFGGVHLSGHDVISLALYTDVDRTYWICVNNDYLPIKLGYVYEIVNVHEINLFAYLTWNRIQQYGVKFSLHNEFLDDRYLKINLYVPYHTLELDMKVNRRNKLYYVFLVKIGDLNYGFDILVQSDTRLNLYLNYNLIKLNLINSFDKQDSNHYVKHGILINIVNNLIRTDKHIHLLLSNHYSDIMSNMKVELSHFRLSHPVSLSLHSSATTSRLEFSYSPVDADLFTVEIFSEETVPGIKTVSKYLLQHKPSNLFYVFHSESSGSDLNTNVHLHYRNAANILNNIGLAFTYDTVDKRLELSGNKNSLRLGYDNSSAWMQINEKPQLKLAATSLTHVDLLYGDLQYSLRSKFEPREFLISVSESINGLDFVDYLSTLKLNHSKLVYGKLLYSGRILETLQYNYIHQYADINVASTHILDGFYDLTQTDLVSTLYTLYKRVVESGDNVVGGTVEEMKRIAEECAGQTDLLFKFNLPQWSRSDQPSLVWDTYESLSSIFKQYLQNMFQVFMIDGSSLFKFTEDIKNLIETSKANIHSLYSHIDSLKTRIKHNTRAILSAVRLKLLELQDLTIQWLRHAEEQTILTVQGIVVDLQKQGITLMQYAYDVKDTLQTFMLHVYVCVNWLSKMFKGTLVISLRSFYRWPRTTTFRT